MRPFVFQELEVMVSTRLLDMVMQCVLDIVHNELYELQQCIRVLQAYVRMTCINPSVDHIKRVECLCPIRMRHINTMI